LVHFSGFGIKYLQKSGNPGYNIDKMFLHTSFIKAQCSACHQLFESESIINSITKKSKIDSKSGRPDEFVKKIAQNVPKTHFSHNEYITFSEEKEWHKNLSYFYNFRKTVQRKEFGHRVGDLQQEINGKIRLEKMIKNVTIKLHWVYYP
jgi:hypothetical protein